VEDEGFAAGRLEWRPALCVGLQEQPVVRDQRDEQAVDVETVPAEHPARGALADAAEQLDAMVDEFVAWAGHAAVLHNGIRRHNKTSRRCPTPRP
jgi:hypothetical protein